MEALYYKGQGNKGVQCELCPHNCIIQSEKSGICNVRVNREGILIAENYGIISSLGFDPIEKKPLYHYYPGSEIFSVGSLGCNLKCKFCQNWQISQTGVCDFSRNTEQYIPGEIVELAFSRKNNLGIAYTYNEPTVFFEYVVEVAKRAKKQGLKNVMVTNGYINLDPLNELNNYIDAYSVDLKAFEEKFFNKYTKSQLEPVKEALIHIAKAGKHIEITNLVIPTLNDDINVFEKMVVWIKESLGENTVLHISRYYPTYKLAIEPTSVEKMIELNTIAKKYLNHVFLGNIQLPEGNNTYCPVCGEIVIKRNGYTTELHSMDSNGNCIKCSNHIITHIN